MIFKLNIKPTKLTGRTKGEVISKMNGIPTYGSYGSYLRLFTFTRGNEELEFVIVYNLQKIRRKTLQGEKKLTKQKGKKCYTKTVVREAGWVGYKYKIPTAILRIAKLEVRQSHRTFTIQNKKK